MFYIASKLAWLVLTPSNLLVIGLIAGAALFVFNDCHRKRWGAWLFSLSLILLLACGIGPLGAMLTRPLEMRFVNSGNAGPIAGIIVLGGAVKSKHPLADAEMLEMNAAGERITAMILLARRYPEAKLVFTGGQGDLFSEGGPEADQVKDHIAPLGLDPSSVVFEDRSRNTYENAVFTADIVKPKPGERWLLVTSAWHMPRSIGCFRAAGFDVVAFPVDFRSGNGVDNGLINTSLNYGLTLTDMAVREWIGLVAYYATGKIAALFPAP